MTIEQRVYRLGRWAVDKSKPQRRGDAEETPRKKNASAALVRIPGTKKGEEWILALCKAFAGL
jgi:hypothetical protein